MYGHVVCVGGGVDLFACGDVGVLESILFHKLEEYPVVHSSEGTLEVRVGCVYVSSLDFGVFVHRNVCGEAIIDAYV